MNRILGVFKLSVATFEEIEHDSNATGQAAMVVVIVSLVAAIGSGIFGAASQSGFLGGFLGTLVWTFLGWIIWSVISFFVGTQLFHGKATLNEMLRVIGFAYAPQILAIIPCIGALAGGIWSLIAGFIAIRQGLDLDDMKAFLTVLVGFVVYIIGSAGVSLIIGLANNFLN